MEKQKNVQFKDFYNAIEEFFEWCGEKGIDDMDEVRNFLEDEEWRPVVGYEGYYEVSNLGTVRGIDRYDCKGRRIKGKVLQKKVEHTGYVSTVLTRNGKPKSYKVHRLVAEAFIPNPDNLPQVNHKDEDKSNNTVWNLEWCTEKYNRNYGTATKRQAQQMINRKDTSKKVIQKDFLGI